MIRLIRRRLIIPRGDTGSFSIPTIGEIGESDVAIFGIFDPLTHKTLVMKKIQATYPTLTINLITEDTVNLEPRKYNWDITIYKEPVYDEDGELIGAKEVNSYYSAFKLPICEITEVALDMDKDRWKTSELTLDTNAYQAANNIQTVYPWEKLQRSQLIGQLYQVAVENGYTGTKDEYLTKYSEIFKANEIISGKVNDFPIPGDTQNLYFDNETHTLYYYQFFEGKTDTTIQELIGARIIIDDENNTHLYVPIKSKVS